MELADSDWIDKGQLGQWIFRLPETPYSKVVDGRPVLASSPDDVQIQVTYADGTTDFVRPALVSAIDQMVFLPVGSGVPESGSSKVGAVTAFPIIDFPNVVKFQVVYYRLTNFVDIMVNMVRTYYCYADDVEVLTRSGWKLFTDCTDEDEFATRNIDTKMFEWQKATGFYCFPFDGELIHFKGQSVDLLVTPNHRMLVSALPKALGGRNGIKKKDHVVEAALLAEYATTATGIIVTSVWRGTEVPNQKFGGSKIKSAGPAPDVIEMSGDDYCAFMGMYLAEGCTSIGKRITISQPKDTRGARALYDQLLSRLFPTVSRNERGFLVHSSALANYLKQFGLADQKFIPEIIREATPRQLEIFWKYYYIGDGAAAGDLGGSQQAFTVSRILAGQLSEIIQKMGSSHTTYIKPASEGFIGGRKITVNEGYFVTRHARRSGYRRGWKTSKVPYVGNVFCVSVPNQFLYVRRNGRACWSGNTVVPVGPGGPTHVPGAFGSEIVDNLQVDRMDYMQREMVRRNQWLFEQVGEPAYLMFRRRAGQTCGCTSTETGSPRTRCEVCFETGIVGGYYGPYDFLLIDPDTAAQRTLDEGGVKVERASRSYLGPTPIVQDGDLVVRRNGERMVISNVTYKTPRGVLLQQDFDLQLLTGGDTRYLIPIASPATPVLYNPVVTKDPLDGQGGAEPIHTTDTIPGKQWENPDRQVGRTITFARIQS
jgi:hypothetical protein